MRKKSLLIVLLLLVVLQNFAQSRGFNYKAVISDQSTVLQNKPVQIKFTLLKETNETAYQETHYTNTDDKGSINLILGKGEVDYGEFSTLNWNENSYFLKVEIDTGSGYREFGTTEFQAVPYAKYAEKAGNTFSGSFKDLTDVPEELTSRSTNIVEKLDDLTDAKTNANSVYLGQHSGTSLTTGNYNTTTGIYSLQHNTTGHNNTAIGFNALVTNTSGYGNTATGSRSLNNNNVGIYNTTNGYYSLYSNTSGNVNTAMGKYALKNNTTGSNNNAFGANALYLNTKGNNNVAIGTSSISSNLEGYNNTATGVSALYGNTFGDNNVALGYKSLYNNNQGNDNTAVGTLALYTNYGSANVAVGKYGLYNNKAGYSNTGVGFKALYSNTQGQRNVANGNSALFYNTTGNFNTALGTSSLYHNTTGSYNTAIGTNAFFNGTNYHNSTAIGSNAYISGDNMVKLGDNYISWIGGHSPWHNTSDGRFKKNIKEDIPGLSFINKLRPVSYTWDLNKLNAFMKVPKESANKDLAIQEKMVHTGFIAQEVAKAAQETGYKFDGVHIPENEDDVYSIAYAQFVVPLIKAVQEQQKQIEDLQKEIQELKNHK